MFLPSANFCTLKRVHPDFGFFKRQWHNNCKAIIAVIMYYASGSSSMICMSYEFQWSYACLTLLELCELHANPCWRSQWKLSFQYCLLLYDSFKDTCYYISAIWMTWVGKSTTNSSFVWPFSSRSLGRDVSCRSWDSVCVTRITLPLHCEIVL
jgi:hypothetical protein